MEKNTTTIFLKKVGGSVAFIVIGSWQLDPSPLKMKMKINTTGKETRRTYTMHIFFILQFRIKLLTGVNWYTLAVLEW